MPCRNFDMDVRFSVPQLGLAGAGAGVMGSAYTFVVLKGRRVRLVRGGTEEPEREILSRPFEKAELLLRLQIRDGYVSFLFGSDDRGLSPLGEAFPMTPGGWTGARPGFFCTGPEGYADVHFVRITEHR